MLIVLLIFMMSDPNTGSRGEKAEMSNREKNPRKARSAIHRPSHFMSRSVDISAPGISPGVITVTEWPVVRFARYGPTSGETN